MAAIECSSCKAEMVKDAKFCGSCGAGQEGIEQLAKRLKADSACGELIQMMTSAGDSKWMERMEKRDIEWESRARELLNVHAEVTDKKIADAVSDSEARQNKTIAELREEMMAKLTMSAKNGAQGPGSSAKNSGRAWQGGQAFTPSKIEIKRFVSNWDRRDTEGISKRELRRWVGTLRLQIGEQHPVAGMVDWDAIDEVNPDRFLVFTKICLKLKEGMGSMQAHEAKQTINEKIEDCDGSLSINGIKPKAVVESPAWKRPILSAGGKALGVLEREGFTCLSIPTWNFQLSVYHSPSDGSKALLICVYDGEKWTVKSENIMKISQGKTAETILAALQR